MADVNIDGVYQEALSEMAEDMCFNTEAGQCILAELKAVPEQQQASIVQYIAQTDKVRTSFPVSHTCISTQSYSFVELYIKQCLGRRIKVGHNPSTDPAIYQAVKNAQAKHIQALHYVGGFVLHRIKKFKKWDSECLDYIIEWSTPLEDKSITEWMDRVNRGGLTHISQDFLNLITTMDAISTLRLQTVAQNCNLTQIVMEAILQHNDFSGFLDIYNPDLLQTITRCFTQVRCKAYVKKHLAKSVSASLRQSLVGTSK